jgi:predicted methyltransferase
MTPLVTLKVHETLRAAVRAGAPAVECSLDLEKSTTNVAVDDSGWLHAGQRFPWLSTCRERTIYHWESGAFQAASRYTTALIKLVPTQWGPPTFEIDGIKMLPTARVSPWEDARLKVSLIQPRGKAILDTCGGLGYFADWCLRGQASRVLSFEKNPDVIWLRSLNPWSPAVSARAGNLAGSQPGSGLTLIEGDISEQITLLPTESVDAILHDPPRFGTAGELYSLDFYEQLARVLRRKGRLFHYTGTPNRLTSGRDVPGEVAKRLRHAGFVTELNGDGVLATRGG